jgi:anti-sigma regulatory factor (Ser/Thr protein kinase)
VLIARLARIDGSQQASWVLPGELTAARDARALVAEPLEKWDLAAMMDTTQLLASELVTNAIRYAEGPVTLRLIKEGTLTCEVLDNSSALPRLRMAARDDERGRGLQIVSKLSARWGARRTPTGKVVWCEQAFPRVTSEDAPAKEAVAQSAPAKETTEKDTPQKDEPAKEAAVQGA